MALWGVAVKWLHGLLGDADGGDGLGVGDVLERVFGVRSLEDVPAASRETDPEGYARRLVAEAFAGGEGRSYQARFTSVIDLVRGQIVEARDTLDSERAAGRLAVLGAELEDMAQHEEFAMTASYIALTLVAIIVNIVVILADSMAILAETISLGQIDSQIQMVQHLIWANGLGELLSYWWRIPLGATAVTWAQRGAQSLGKAQLPGPSDLVRFQLRDAFDSTERARQLDDSDRSVFERYMGQQGYNKYWSDSYWAAHWANIPSGHLNEMLFRGVISQEEWQKQTKFNDVVPYAIGWEEAIIYQPYTRVDARRMHELGVLTDAELLQAYADLGYYAPTELRADGRYHAVMVAVPDFGTHKAQAMVVWTKLENQMPQLRARYGHGWIDDAELLAALRAIGLPETRARLAYEEIVKAQGPERAVKRRDLTMTQVTRSVKLGVIGAEQGLLLLTRLGYSLDEAQALLQSAKIDLAAGAVPNTDLGRRLLAEYGAV